MLYSRKSRVSLVAFKNANAGVIQRTNQFKGYHQLAIQKVTCTKYLGCNESLLPHSSGVLNKVLNYSFEGFLIS